MGGNLKILNFDGFDGFEEFSLNYDLVAFLRHVMLIKTSFK